MKIGSILLTGLICFVLAAPRCAHASTPTEAVRKTVDEVVRIVSNKELKKPANEHKRREELRQAIGSIFDYTQMSQRSLARYWRDRTPAERKEFTQLFESVLENSYANKIESYNNEKVVYLREVVNGNYAEVRSKVITAKHDEYSLDYRLMNENGKWMVYDVVIEGVSLVANYRGQFGDIIRADGYPALVKKLKAKSKEIKSL